MASRYAGRQLFVGGAPRSGTTCLQQLLDAHPDVSCRGEALVPQRFAPALDAAVAGWCETLPEGAGALARLDVSPFGWTP